ncbi:CusA/CzcA family heavy metal efflux RND transporter (plasmid) [Verrucomicrobiaceae bacterium 227]
MLNKLLQFALSQRFLAVVIACVIAVWGAWCYQRVPIDAFPDISNTQVQVIVNAPGMTPLEVEQRITNPIEVEVRGIQNQTILRSTTKYALSVITIDFDDGTDIYWARQQVSERISQVLAGLPGGVEGGLAPITMPLSDVYMFLVEGEGYSNMELRGILDWIIRPRLLSVEGVADVNALGGEVKSYHVIPDPEKLASYKISVGELVEALEKNNRNAGGDRFTRNHEEILVTTVGQLSGIEDIGGVPILSRNGVPVHISDVAEIRVGALTRYGGVTAHGKGEVVEGIVVNRRGANSRMTIEGIKAVLKDLEPSLPKGVKIVPFYDRSDLVTAAVGTVESALIQGVVLVVIVLLLFLANIRSAISVGIILPLSVLATFIPMYYFGITANLMSLGGIAIAIGILVDSAVVMVEDIHGVLRGEKGKERLKIVWNAAKEVAPPILSGVIIIIVSFIPILTMTGLEGKLFRPLALTVVIAIASSLFLSITVIPVVASLIMNGGTTEGNIIVRIIQRVYQPLLNFALRFRIVAVSIALVFLAIAVFLGMRTGKEFLPYLDEGTLVLQFEKLPSISLEKSLEIDDAIAKALMKIPEIEGLVSRVGADELRLDPMGLNESDVFLVTKPRDQWTVDSLDELQDKIREVVERFPGVIYGFTQPIDMRVSEMISGATSAVAIKLNGDDLDVLEAKSREIESLVANTRGAVDVSRTPLRGQMYLSIRMNHREMSRLGLSVEDVNQLVGSAIAGTSPTEIIEGNRRTPVLVRFPREYRLSPEAMANLNLETPAGHKVKLGDITTITEEDGPVTLERENGKRQLVIESNVQGRDVVGFVNEIEKAIGQKVDLPPGFFVEYDGQFANQARASARLALVVPVSIFLIFMILLSTFQRLRLALLILCNVPFAFIGGIALLYATGLYLSVPASVGFIALLGLAVMNGVVLVNYFNQLRAEHPELSLEEIVTRGATRRLRPVLMTAILTVLGLVPLLLASGPGSEVQKPLALVVIGGTFSSTLLTLILLPTLYVWIERRAHRKGNELHTHIGLDEVFAETKKSDRVS